MSDMENPCPGPRAPANPGAAEAARITGTMLGHLKKASPWIRFLGILGFIGSGCMALGGVVFLVFVPVLESLWSESPVFEDYSGFTGIFLGLYFMVSAALYFFPARYAYRFGTRIRAFLESGVEQDLEAAFQNNKSLWKFLGIASIVGLACIPLLGIVGIIAGLASLLA